MKAHEAKFRAMGSDAHVIVLSNESALLDRVIARISELEARWSRFIETSEISEINRRAGEDVPVTPDTRMLIERSVAAWRQTGGAFDPTVLGDVIRAGYDRSFVELGEEVRPGSSVLGKGVTNIVIGESTVRLPHSVGFDPGGIGKGLAADLVATEAMAAGADGVCVNLGGDLRALGCSPLGDDWTVAVEHQLVDAPIAVVAIGDGAVATSTTLRRRWSVDGEVRHHLIDPSTGAPSASDVSLVTVVGAETWSAEVLAKAELLRGSERLFDLVGGTGAEAFAVLTDGRVVQTDGMRRFVAAPGLPERIELADTEGVR